MYLATHMFLLHWLVQARYGSAQATKENQVHMANKMTCLKSNQVFDKLLHVMNTLGSWRWNRAWMVTSSHESLGVTRVWGREYI